MKELYSLSRERNVAFYLKVSSPLFFFPFTFLMFFIQLFHHQLFFLPRKKCSNHKIYLVPFLNISTVITIPLLFIIIIYLLFCFFFNLVNNINEINESMKFLKWPSSKSLIGHVASRAIARENESCSKLPMPEAILERTRNRLINMPGFIVFQLCGWHKSLNMHSWTISEACKRLHEITYTHTLCVGRGVHILSQERRASIKTIWRLIGCGLYNECFPIFIQEHPFCRDVTDKWCLYHWTIYK